MSWPGARDYCRTHHTDLTSVRNEEENQKIQEVAGDLTVWVGLFTDTFKWSDQSNSSFRYWKEGDRFSSPRAERCVNLVIHNSGRWEKQPCHWLRRVFCNCELHFNLQSLFWLKPLLSVVMVNIMKCVCVFLYQVLL